MRPRLAGGNIGIDQCTLHVMGKELTTATVRKNKAIILKVLNFKIMPCYLQ